MDGFDVMAMAVSSLKVRCFRGGRGGEIHSHRRDGNFAILCLARRGWLLVMEDVWGGGL